MNIPNKITILRLLLIPFFVLFLLMNRYIESFIVFLIASYTDHLDGKIARKYGQITDFGRFADPLADKALIMSAFACFVEMKEVSCIVLILLLIREFAVMSVRLVTAESGKVISANFLGKAKTVSQIFVVQLIILLLAIRSFYGDISYSYLFWSNAIKNFCVWGCTILSLVSGLKYLYENYEFIEDIK